MKYVVAPQFQVTGDHITHHKGFCVTHVQIARGVRKHVKHIPAFPRTVVSRDEGLVGFPERLPALLGSAGVVTGPLPRSGLGRCSSLLDPLDLLGHDLFSFPWLCIAALDMKKPLAAWA